MEASAGQRRADQVTSKPTHSPASPLRHATAGEIQEPAERTLMQFAARNP